MDPLGTAQTHESAVGSTLLPVMATAIACMDSHGAQVYQAARAAACWCNFGQLA